MTVESKVNYVAVGIFTVLAIIATFLSAVFISYRGTSGDIQQLDIRIHGAVTGLGTGSQVLFNGIPIGTVKSILLDKNDPNVVIAQAMIDGSVPITASTQAALGFQGLTGYAFIDLRGGSLKEASILRVAKADGTIASIEADGSAVNNLMSSAKDIAGQATAVTHQLGALVTAVNQPLQETVKNVESISKILGDNAHNIQGILQQTNLLLSKLNLISSHTNGIITKLDSELDTRKNSSLLLETKRTLVAVQQTANTLSKTIAPFSSPTGSQTGLHSNLSNLMLLLNQSQRTIERIESSIRDIGKNPSKLLFGGHGSVPRYDAGK